MGGVSPPTCLFYPYHLKNLPIYDIIQIEKNIFGDILGIYKNAELIVKYAYDAWGVNKTYVSDGSNWVLLENSAALDSNSDYARNVRIAKLNPFLYHGYCYDRETRLYYLNARYYDPQVGRVISPDLSNLDSTSINGLNLYSYAKNNPINIAYNSSIFGTYGSIYNNVYNNLLRFLKPSLYDALGHASNIFAVLNGVEAAKYLSHIHGNPPKVAWFLDNVSKFNKISNFIGYVAAFVDGFTVYNQTGDQGKALYTGLYDVGAVY